MPPKDYAERLLLASRVTEPAIRQAIQGLSIPPGSVGLDAGCGIGQHTLWLAQSVGPEGNVTGLDIFEDNLAVAREMANQSPADSQVQFAQGALHGPSGASPAFLACPGLAQGRWTRTDCRTHVRGRCARTPDPGTPRRRRIFVVHALGQSRTPCVQR